ncbi:hypothetical protein COEREDRAFT_80963 [Coemansia reversa NRRL 1564]|uniref:Amino acid transporter transmembrane domain-containing protein n=1 Tax=Coemansia reversa (strain ATCC 12441 / NRRL 1564) TaxID=763665 RepID=A0A2G5BD35_COERN|nr:hypothetical protein COEREDRAFT_80963 [Coemansia reversa NRRL 1564]|eukprot:PIA16921.1 hypothetical protein COEREDRAFT_80963 [Coemansia reversa NRRL 1564]
MSQQKLHHRQPLLAASTTSNSNTSGVSTSGSNTPGNGYGSADSEQESGDTNADAAHRHLSSSTETFFHIVCITAGTGILQLPYALKSGGWIGVLYIALAAAISAYCGKILICCLYHKDGVRLKSYSEVAEAAFGPRGRMFLRALKDFNLLGVVGIYIVLAGVSINSLAVGSAVEHLGARFWIAASSVAVWAAVVLAREVHDVFFLSIFGTLTTVAMVIIVICLGISDFEFLHTRPPTKLVDLNMAPISLASICYSFGGNLNWPDLEGSMKSPKKWSMTLSLATGFVAFIYLCVAIVGYGVYGDYVRSPIFLNLPPGLAVVAAEAMITAHVLLTCPILLTAVFIEAERDMSINSDTLSLARERLYRIGFRSLVIVVIAFFALFVSDFSKIVPVLGAFAASLVVFVIPVACYIRLFKDQLLFSVWEYAWCALIVCVGLGCLVVGTSQAIADL